MVRLAAALLLLVPLAHGQHAVSELACPEEIQYRIAQDVNGDGIDDLLLVTGTEVWYWYGGKRTPRKQPDAKLALPQGSALFDVGGMGKQGFAFVVRTAQSLFRLTPGQAPTLLGPAGSGIPVRAANVLWRTLFTDLDKDGLADFIDVGLGGYVLRFGNQTQVRIPPLISERVDTSAGAASDRYIARFAFAEWIDGNFNGDLRPDFALMTPRGLLVYPGDEHGRPDPARSFEIPIPEAEDAELTLEDFNRDGQTDALAVHADEGQATILLADRTKGLAAARRVRLTVPGQMRKFIVADLNGDGRKDLALPYVPKLSFQDVLRVVARREVVLKVPLFLNQATDRVFGPLADSRMSLPVRVRVTTDSIGRVQLGGLIVVEYEGDLDGDGRPDLVVTDTPSRLAVHAGVPVRVYREEPSSHIDIPDCSQFESVKSAALDINGDGSSDIILHYRGAGRRPDRLFVLWSRKG